MVASVLPLQPKNAATSSAECKTVDSLLLPYIVAALIACIAIKIAAVICMFIFVITPAAIQCLPYHACRLAYSAYLWLSDEAFYFRMRWRLRRLKLVTDWRDRVRRTVAAWEQIEYTNNPSYFFASDYLLCARRRQPTCCCCRCYCYRLPLIMLYPIRYLARKI